MKPELRERIIAYNKKVYADASAAKDMRTIAAEMKNLPPGQLKKVLSENVIAVLKKYGVELE